MKVALTCPWHCAGEYTQCDSTCQSLVQINRCSSLFVCPL